MKPYYEDGYATIYHGDCREILPNLDLVADLVITDPPYGETSLEWDICVADWLDPLPSNMSDQASLWVFGSLRMFMKLAADFDGWKSAQDVVWEKHNGSNFHADRFRRVHEHVAQFYRHKWGEVYKVPQVTMDATARTVRRQKRPTHTRHTHTGHIDAGSYASDDGGPRLTRSVLRVRSCNGYADHPTQKPLGILTPLIEYSSPPGALVLDPFAGSGSTLVAAKLTGRKSIGIELDERHCEAAASRLSQGTLQLA